MTREEYLDWAKNRAIEYINQGEPHKGFISMLTDLNNHEKLKNHGGFKTVFYKKPGWTKNELEVRNWVMSFN